MTAITEDTPEGGPDELQWKIDRLIEQNERQAAETERERSMRRDAEAKWRKAEERMIDITSRMRVGDLRKAGFTVTITPPEACDTCGEEY